MNLPEAYIERVRWHKNHCEWHEAWKKDRKGNVVGVGERPFDRRRICFALEEGLCFFGVSNVEINSIDCWEETPGDFGDCYAWESVEKWCYETENHPGIPVVRTYPR